MKKAFFVFLILMLFVSCSSTSHYRAQAPTEEEARYALKYVLKKALENTKSSIYSRFKKEKYLLPPQYSILLENIQLPGIDRTLNAWDEYITDYTLYVIQELNPVVEEEISKLKFTDAVNLVSFSNSSGTAYLQTNYGAHIRQFIYSQIKKADWKLLQEAVAIYNSYIMIGLHFNKSQDTGLEEVNLDSYYTDLITGEYFKCLANNEEILRTTPDPYAKAEITKVFKNW